MECVFCARMRGNWEGARRKFMSKERPDNGRNSFKILIEIQET